MGLFPLPRSASAVHPITPPVSPSARALRSARGARAERAPSATCAERRRRALTYSPAPRAAAALIAPPSHPVAPDPGPLTTCGGPCPSAVARAVGARSSNRRRAQSVR
eukprot:6203495-Pleurochrysis_carterae.AAC.1